MNGTSKSLRRVLALALSAGSALCLGSPAMSLNIVLHTDSSFDTSTNGAAALYAFQKAANYWNQTLTNNVTLNFDVSFSSTGFSSPNIIGQTGSNSLTESASAVYAGLSQGSRTALDSVAVANLRPLSAAGGVGYRMPSAVDPTSPSNAQRGLNTTAGSVYDNDDTFNNRYMVTNTANARVLGLTVDPLSSAFGTDRDAEITFNSAFAFDFDPTDGIAVGTQDFTSVAIHEMGHALGFVSGADVYDYYATPNGPGRAGPFGATFDWDNGSFVDFGDGPVFITPEVLTVLDLFRYSTNGGASGFDPLTGKRYLQLDPNREAGFSLDASTFYNGNGIFSNFATGQFNGDGSQASHWKDAPGSFDINNCFTAERVQAGIMDPTSGSCQQGIVTANDLAAMDAIGYNVGLDLYNNRSYNFDTKQVFALAGLASVAGVPEPATWAQMLLGFGLIGGFLRQRGKAKVAFAS